MSDPAYAPDPADELAQFAEASKSPEDFWLVYRTLMARYDSSCRMAHMTAFADEVAALAVSALAAIGRLHADAETRTEWGVRFTRPDGGTWILPRDDEQHARMFLDGDGRELIRRRIGPWLPAPTTNTEDTP